MLALVRMTWVVVIAQWYGNWVIEQEHRIKRRLLSCYFKLFLWIEIVKKKWRRACGLVLMKLWFNLAVASKCLSFPPVGVSKTDSSWPSVGYGLCHLPRLFVFWRWRSRLKSAVNVRPRGLKDDLTCQTVVGLDQTNSAVLVLWCCDVTG